MFRKAIAFILLLPTICLAAEEIWYDAEPGPWHYSATETESGQRVRMSSYDPVLVSQWRCCNTSGETSCSGPPHRRFNGFRSSNTIYGYEQWIGDCETWIGDGHDGDGAGYYADNGAGAIRRYYSCPVGQARRKINGKWYCELMEEDPPCDCFSGCTKNPVNPVKGGKFKNISIYSDSYFDIGFYYTYPVGNFALEIGQWRLSYEGLKVRAAYDEQAAQIGFLVTSDSSATTRYLLHDGAGKYYSSSSRGSYVEYEEYNPNEWADKGFKLVSGTDHYHFNARGNLIWFSENGETFSVETYYRERIESSASEEIAKAGTLERFVVTHSSGASVEYNYSHEGYPTSIQLSSGEIVTLTYSTENLISGNPILLAIDDATRQLTFHYENPDYPYALTGISDDQNGRLETYAYDAGGRAISSELAGGAERVEVSYGGPRWDFSSVTVKNPLGKETTYHIEEVGPAGERRVTAIDGHASNNCEAASRDIVYDTNGAIISKTDWEGNVTTYTRDNLGRELTRTEAAGTPSARTITTEWHPTLNLPVRVTAPGSVTHYSYDSAGHLLSKQVVPVANP